MLGRLRKLFQSKPQTDHDRGHIPAKAIVESESCRQQANQSLVNGNLSLAEELYLRAIECNPENGDAKVGLGFVFFSTERYAQAQAQFLSVLEQDSSNSDAHYLLGLIAKIQGEPGLAVSYFSNALKSKPEHIEARLGFCKTLVDQGRSEEALKSISEAEGFGIISADLLILKADILFQQGKNGGAQSAYLDAIKMGAGSPAVFNALGMARFNRSDHEGAIEEFLKALDLDSDFLPALSNLGFLMLHIGDLDRADAYLCRAVANKSSDAQTHYRMALVLDRQGDKQAALQHAGRSIELDGQQFQYLALKGHLQFAMGDYPEAALAFSRAVELNPSDAESYGNLALCYLGMEKFGGGDYLSLAEISANRSVVLDRNAWSLNVLGNVFYRQGRISEAEQKYREGAVLEPQDTESRRNLMAVLAEQGLLPEAVKIAHDILAVDPEDPKVLSCLLFYASCSPDGTPSTYLKLAKRYGDGLLASLPKEQISQPRPVRADGLLRIGFVSGDYRAHPVAYFLESVLAHMDKRRFQLYAYSASSDVDDTTLRLKSLFSEWRVIEGTDDVEATKMICKDNLDILVDLSGHTEYNRLGIFARKPAPIQVSWLGYWASTGIPTIDYFLSDPISVPESQRQYFVESVYYLPETRLCFTPPDTTLAVAQLPAVANGFVTFGSFQKLTKINDEVLSLWGRVMRAIPNARLRLQTAQLSCAQIREKLLERFNAFGIGPERVMLLKNSTRDAYLAAHSEVDIILDTFPYAGGTTTCEALWMGVPTMTLAGETLLSRQGASMMSCVGLSNWVAETPHMYVDQVVGHASDLEALQVLRSDLRARIRLSPLFDAPRFARHLETAFTTMAHEKMPGTVVVSP